MCSDARKVFSVFCAALRTKKGGLGWFLQFEDFESGSGIPRGDIEPALSVLVRKGLIERRADDMWSLTDFGAEACDDPAELDNVFPVH